MWNENGAWPVSPRFSIYTFLSSVCSRAHGSHCADLVVAVAMWFEVFNSRMTNDRLNERRHTITNEFAEWVRNSKRKKKQHFFSLSVEFWRLHLITNELSISRFSKEMNRNQIQTDDWSVFFCVHESTSIRISYCMWRAHQIFISTLWYNFIRKFFFSSFLCSIVITNNNRTKKRTTWNKKTCCLLNRQIFDEKCDVGRDKRDEIYIKYV